MDSPLLFKYFFIKISLNDANDAPPRLDRGLNGTVGGAISISFLQGTRRNLDESPLLKGGSLATPTAHQRCKPEPMVGTMNPLEGEPSPFQGGEEVS